MGAKQRGADRYDQIARRASARDARERGKRLRICRECWREGDHVFGTVHSEEGCQRCRAPGPCWGYVIEVRLVAVKGGRP